MSDFENKDKEEVKDQTIEKCIAAINETQNKIAEEESMRELIKQTLDEINEKEIVEKEEGNKLKSNRFINRIMIRFNNIKNILKRKKYKTIIIRLMMAVVMGIFMFNGAINRVYANDYKLQHIDDSKLENSSDKQDDTSADEQGNNDYSDEDNDSNEFIGVNEEGKKYSYDAVKINEKLKTGDYSNDGEKIVFLTFDDGTSTTVTPKVLNILDQYKVKATFFLMGKNIEDGGQDAKNLVKKEFDNGHAIGNHSYSHDYNVLYPGRYLNLESFKADYDKNDKLLKSILGDNFSTRVLRCPGGYMSWKGMSELDVYLKDNNMTYIDWNALSKDAEGKKKNADELVQFAVETSEGKEIVVLLMHDTYGKEETAKSLPKIIEYFENNGYEFKTLA